MKRLLIYTIMLLTALDASAQNHNFETAKQLDIFNALYRQLDLNYVDTLDARKLVGEAIDYMLSKVDPYTTYYRREDSSNLRMLSTGKYAGIGSPIVFRKDLDCPVFSDPYQDMPAYRSGLRSGDRLMSIDGKPVGGLHPAQPQEFLDSVTHLLRGEPGTEVTLQILRPVLPVTTDESLASADSLRSMTIRIVREQIHHNNVTHWQMLPGEVGYILLTGYTDDAASEVKTAFQALKSQGMKSLVLDLRGNGGGLLQEAVSLVAHFVKRGTEVVSIKGRNKRANETYCTTTEPLDRKMPIVVLTDYATASSAEITCGALQDLDRAVIVGARTYGKGLVQQSAGLPYNGALKYTAAKYYIPSGRCIQALDYSNRGEDGQPKHLPDSLCHTFYTRNHRAVLDGGGILPDVVVKGDSLPSIVTYLRMSPQLFDWGVRYHNTHPEIESVHDFRLTDQDMADLCAYLKRNHFSYDNQSAQQLSNLRRWTEWEGYKEEASALIDELQKILAHNLDRDFSRWAKPLREVAESELIANYYGEAGSAAYAIKDDAVLREALSILQDSKRYARLLGR